MDPGASRPANQVASSLVLVVVTVMAVAIGLVAVWLRYGLGHVPEGVPHLVAGWVAVACGVFAWWRVPWSRTGPMVVAVGLTWYLTDLAGCLNLEPFTHRCLDTGVVADGAAAVSWLWLGILCHVLLAFPSGHLRTPLERFGALGGYALATAIPVWPAAALVAMAGLLGAGPAIVLARVSADERPDVAPAVVVSVGVAGALLVAELSPLYVAELTLSLAAIGLTVALASVDERRHMLDPDRAVELSGALAVALRDPGLRVAFQAASGDGWSDASGRAVPRPSGVEGIEITSIERDGSLLAVVAHDRATLADPNVRSAVTMAVELAAHNARLRAALARQLAEVGASRRRLVDAALGERRDLGDRVDDDVQRPLRRLATELDEMMVDEHVRDVTDGHVASAADQLARARDEIGALASGLYPLALEARGLATSLRDLATRSPIPADVHAPGHVSGGRAVDATLYFVCSEALANAARHARATHVAVRLTATDGALQLVIEDDGSGGADMSRGSGLSGLRDRVDALGGTLSVDSPMGRGTRLVASLTAGPVASDTS